MCMNASSVRPAPQWNWQGDEIVHRPIIPASRTIPGTQRRFDTDIREFLTTKNNAVVAEHLGKLIKALPDEEQALFRSHSRGSFDFRADCILALIRQFRYLPTGQTEQCPEAWLYPDETLAQGGGDCEDLSFLLAALLLAAGISPYCIRVALGSVLVHEVVGVVRRHDHSWVMYQSEAGVWEILEPLQFVKAPRLRTHQRAGAGTETEYVPHFVFNTDHLWLVRTPHAPHLKRFQDYWGRREFWHKFDPGFAAGIHNHIFDTALKDIPNLPASALSAMKRMSLWLDVSLPSYDPRDHFDNGYIEAGWQRVGARLAKFQQDRRDWSSFGAAGHAIADFYAHSSYVHFAQLLDAADAQLGRALTYAPDVPLAAVPDYTATASSGGLPPFDLATGPFTRNRTVFKGTAAEAAGFWAGQLISGRYAQRGDSQSFFEAFTNIPLALTRAAEFPLRGGLPHHDEIAVDDTTPSKRHRLYRANCLGPEDRHAYANQFRWRKQTAIAHIRQAFLEVWQA